MTEENKALAVWNPFQVIERLDDKALIAEIRGKALQAYVYQFFKDGKPIRGLSVKGVEAACREMAVKHGMALRILNHHVERTDTAYIAVVTAGRYMVSSDGREVLLDTALGSKEEPFLETRRGGSTYPNTDAYDKALSKAARNAKLKLMPEDLKQAIIAEFIKLGKVQNVDVDQSTGEIIDPDPPKRAAPKQGVSEALPTRDTQKPAEASPSPATSVPQPKGAGPKAQGTYTGKEIHDALGMSAPEWCKLHSKTPAEAMAQVRWVQEGGEHHD